LENDPARRYQHASEVKAKVETIAGTPTPASTASPQEPQFIRWAGFRLVKVSDSTRAVNWSQALFALALVFGVLTIAFGLVTLASGRSLMGWLGVVGLPSVVARLALSVVFVAQGVNFAWRSKPKGRSLPQTPQGTVILPPERVSRKAVIGVC